LLDIEEDSKVFCAEESISALELLKFYNASNELGDFKRYNFLTSRFFSAVDVKLDYKPDVIMITDVYSARHSILDPITEVVQISGRFRKKQESKDRVTTNSLTHITNLQSKIEFQTPNQAAEYIEAALSAYQTMTNNRDSDIRQGAVDTYTQGMANTEIKDFIKPDGTVDTYMFDNYLHQQRVRSYYKDYESLNEAYIKSEHFNVKYTPFVHQISDEDNMQLAMAKSQVQRTEAVANLLLKYTEKTEGLQFRFYDPETEINRLRAKYSDVVDAFFIIGYPIMKANMFKMHLIQKLVAKEKLKQARLQKSLVAAIHREFEGDVFVLEPEV